MADAAATSRCPWRSLAAFIALLLAVYIAIDPFKHSPLSSFPDLKAHKIDSPPWSALPKADDPLNKLQNSEIKFNNQIHGPESIAFDPQGRGPYTGVSDGRVVFWDSSEWKDFAYTSPNRSGICTPGGSPFGNVGNEHLCGRPLGLRFDKRNGDLYIADAYFGILKVGPQGGLATRLVTEVDGIPLNFANDLDIDSDGNVYFTDSSSLYTRRNFVFMAFSADQSGRVIKYDPSTKKSTVLMRNLLMPNGLTLSKDESFFVVCETVGGRLSRYWIKGHKAGTSEIFAIMPGPPDNVRTNDRGEFWVALHCKRNMFSYIVGIYPSLRKAILSLPIPAKYQYLPYVGGRLHGAIAKYSVDGELVEILEDKEGKVVRAVSEVEERDGKLWIGSVLTSFIAVY